MGNKLSEKWKAVPIQAKASVCYTVCGILQRSLSFITMPLFTGLLTTEQYGQYSVYLSWSSIFTIFITLNMAYGSFPKAMVEFEGRRQEYIAAVQNICLALTVLFLAVYLPVRGLWNRLFQMPTALVLVMLLEILGQFSIACWYAFKRFEYKYKGVVALTLANALLMPLCAFLLVMGSDEKGYARILGYALVSIAVGGVLFFQAAIRGQGGLDKGLWQYALRFNLPLIPYYLSQVIFNQSDKIMIDHMCGTDKAGIYGVAYTLALVLTFVLNAINNSYVPWFYGKLKAGRAGDNRGIASGIAILMAFLLLGVIALTPEIIAILTNKPDYAEAIWVVPPVAVSLLLLFYSQLFINVEFYYEEKMLLVWGSVAAALLNVLLNWLLIPVFGFVAAGYTTLFSYLVFAAANYACMRYLLRKRNIACDAFDLKALAGICLVFMALAFLAMALYRLPLARYAIIAAVLLALVIWRKQALAFVRRILLRDAP